MDYIRWLVLEKFGHRTDIFIPGLFLTGWAVFMAFVIHVLVGIIVLTIALSVVGTIAYVFAYEAYKKSRAQYEKEKSKP